MTKVERKRQQRAQRTAKGLCTCGQSPVPGMKTCSRCQAKDKRYRAKPETQVKHRQRDKLRYKNNREKILQRSIDRNWKQKQQVIEAYGGICACCGEDGLQFLALDHVNGDGAEHRRMIAGHLYRLLIKQNFPRKDEFQVLCHNCNWAKGTGVACPHQTGTVIRLTSSNHSLVRPDEASELLKAA